MEIAIVAFDDFTDIDVFLPWDILNRVKYPGWNVKIYGTKDYHFSVTGLTVPVHSDIEEENHHDHIVYKELIQMVAAWSCFYFIVERLHVDECQTKRQS
jgi:putative intracellular protease/amidase